MTDYVVEGIEGKRIVNGVTEYLLKWHGYPRSENTWEPVENLSCPDFIAAFEESERNKAQAKKRPSSEYSNTRDEQNKKITFIKDETEEKFGFERGLVASKILGATDSSGKLMFLMSWENSDRYELVPAKLANVKCPHVVIKFYEERLTWESDKKNENNAKRERSAKNDNKVEIDLTVGEDVNF
ncbi:heterochromatin protein 1J [Drosophila virilis]|uniref:Heterochromatin protein 1J n=1 Tax=Drosophila virilis TaxID=7244 RepID=B4LQ93_DROVI|nr:chromobox protein homolog 1 [Drosophila virilis]EDW61378.1 heterochromatin protein 1J [Drosophila virilis]